MGGKHVEGADIFDELAHCLDLPPFLFSLRLAFGRRTGRCVYIFNELKYRPMSSPSSFCGVGEAEQGG